MGKKLILLFSFYLALSLVTVQNLSLADTLSNTKTTVDFKDLKDVDAKTKSLVNKWVSKGVIQGVSEDRFGLNETISRAEFAKILALAVRLKVDTSLKISRFKDISISDSVYGSAIPYIEALRAAEVTDGVEFYSFDPSGLVTREQLAIFAIRSLRMEAEALSTPEIVDYTVSEYAKRHVALATKLYPNLFKETPYNGTMPINRQLILYTLEEIARTYCGCGTNDNINGKL